MSAIVKRIRAELKDASEESARSSYQRFFKEEVRFHGVKTGTVKTIANRYWKEIKASGKQEIFGLCEELYRSGYCEEAFVVSNWVPKLAGAYEPEDLATFHRWIETYIDNWAECDGFCNHSVGSFLEKFPDSAPEVKSWAESDNRWLKRAAAVSFIVPAKKGGVPGRRLRRSRPAAHRPGRPGAKGLRLAAEGSEPPAPGRGLRLRDAQPRGDAAYRPALRHRAHARRLAAASDAAGLMPAWNPVLQSYGHGDGREGQCQHR